MIKVTVLYPSGEGKKFDIDYYSTHHMPMVQRKCGPACTKIAVDRGIEGAAPGSKPAFAAIGYLYFESVDAFRSAFAPHAGEIMADIPNYTDIEPTIQISEVTV